MNKTEINAKLQYVFEGLPLSRVQKEMLGDVVTAIIETAIAGTTEPNITKATTDTLGLVKQAATIEALEESDEIATVISTVNTLISNLKTAGVVANN